MNLLVSLEHRFMRTPNGKVWSQTMFDYKFWIRYLNIFDHVNVVARIKDVDNIPADWNEASGPGVSFLKIPYYIGPEQFLIKLLKIKKEIKKALEKSEAVILRVPSIIGTIVEKYCIIQKRPYAVEVVGDPYDTFSPGSFRHPIRPFMRWWAPRCLRRQCKNAIAAAYVTEMTLQKRYPCNGYQIGISSVYLDDEWFINCIRKFEGKNEIKIIFVGSINHFYKAPDILLKAFDICVKGGLNLKLVIVGGGKYIKELKKWAEKKNINNRITFTGQLSHGKAVYSQLDDADLFVLPSRQEGLPRAMIEAMARGLPCIGSTVGGIPELLQPEDLVIPGDDQALAQKIKEVVTNPERMNAMSARNLAKAREYREEILSEKRNSFYRYVKEKTEEWIKKRK